MWHVSVAHFDCTQWFEQAGDEELRALVECGFGGDYAADEVASFYEDKNPEVAAMFAVTGNTGAGPKGDEPNGFECQVDRREAVAWMRNHRPHIELADEAD
jgi:hypothetical protein